MARTHDPRMTEAILDAALELTRERGFANVTMEAIAARAAVGKPAIYRRFADKAQLVAAALKRMLPPMEAGTDDSSRDLREQLRELVERTAPDDPAAYAALLGGLMAEHRRHPELIAAYRESVLAPRRAIVRAAIERGQAAGVFDPALDADQAVDMLGGAFMMRAYAGLDMSRRWRDALFEHWWAMLRARP